VERSIENMLETGSIEVKVDYIDYAQKYFSYDHEKINELRSNIDYLKSQWDSGKGIKSGNIVSSNFCLYYYCVCWSIYSRKYFRTW